MNVRWSVGDETVISAGGNDKCLFQWKHVMNENRSNPHTSRLGLVLRLDLGFVLVLGLRTYHTLTLALTNDNNRDYHDKGYKSEEEVLDSLQAPTGGDESGCVKPWLGAVKAPKNAPSINPSTPGVNMKLSWVHGYTSGMAGVKGGQGNRVSNNLYYNSDGDVLYPAAALGIKLEISSSSSLSSSKQVRVKVNGRGRVRVRIRVRILVNCRVIGI
jgi:hypothetical protein